MKVTFVGVGAIGLPMALQVRAAGHDVTGVDPSPVARDAARSHGLATVDRIAEAERGDVVIVMVATPDQLASVVAQATEAARGQVWVIMSTVGPEAIRERGEALRHLGARVVDAPVTGGVARAALGELIIFAAGAADDVARAESVLCAMGMLRTTGERLGDGQSIKLVNQHLCSVHIVAAAEALSLARSLGLDPATVLGLVESGAAGSWMLSDRGPRMVAGTDVEVTSAIDIFVKDSGLVAMAAATCAAELPLLQAAHARFKQAASAGLGRRDDSRVIETWDRPRG